MLWADDVNGVKGTYDLSDTELQRGQKSLNTRCNEILNQLTVQIQQVPCFFKV